MLERSKCDELTTVCYEAYFGPLYKGSQRKEPKLKKNLYLKRKIKMGQFCVFSGAVARGSWLSRPAAAADSNTDALALTQRFTRRLR